MMKFILKLVAWLFILVLIVSVLDAIGIIDLKKMAAEEEQKKVEKEQKAKEEREAKQKKLDELFELENMGYDLAFREKPVHNRSEFYLVDVDKGIVTHVKCTYKQHSSDIREKTITTTNGYNKNQFSDLQEVDVTQRVSTLKELIANESTERMYEQLFPKE